MCHGVTPTGSDIQGAWEGVARTACEEELTRQVPALLDAMNRAATEVNALERRTSEAQLRYKRRLGHWNRLYEDLRSLYGSSFDRVKPYFDRAEAALECIQGVVDEFSRAQHDAPHDLQDRLDRLQHRCAAAVREHREAQQALARWRKKVGDAASKRTLPCFRLLREHQQRLLVEQGRIHELEERTGAAKTAYGRSMRELERISMEVHRVREEAAGNAQTATPESEGRAKMQSVVVEPEVAPARL